MNGRMGEVFVGGQHGQLVTTTQLDQQRIDRSDLNARPTAGVSNLSGCDVVLPVRLNHGQRAKPLDDRGGSLWSGEALQEFLQHQTRRDDGLWAEQRLVQGTDSGLGTSSIAPQRQRPDARVHQQGQRLLRSAL